MEHQTGGTTGQKQGPPATTDFVVLRNDQERGMKPTANYNKNDQHRTDGNNNHLRL